MKDIESTTLSTMSRSAREDSGTIFHERPSKYRFPILSNKILVKRGDAKVLGASFTGWGNLSEGSLVNSLVLDESSSRSASQEKIDCLYPDSDEPELIASPDSGSSWTNEEPEVVPENVPATLKLLEEVKYRFFGEDVSVTIPEIETVEITPLSNSKLEVISMDVVVEVVGGKEEQKEEQIKENEDIAKHVRIRGDAKDDIFLDTVKYSERFVDNILLKAKLMCKLKHERNVALVDFHDELCKHRCGNIQWPPIEKFSIQTGIESIARYIHDAFNLLEDWKYQITYLISQSDRASDFHFYEAKFGIPTHFYPVPQITVSIYFTFEVSRVVPEHLPVKVTFTLESLRTVMVPGDVEVNDKMLLSIMECKMKIFKQLDF